MAWRCSGKTNEELVQNMVSAGLLKNREVISAMLKVDRKNYVLERDRRNAYVDSPQSIDYHATISAPHMHAHALEKLAPSLLAVKHDERRCLDIGFGSGYLTACLAVLSGEGSKVYGVEHIEELVAFARGNIKRDQPGLMDGRVELVCSDGRLGLAEKGPFDVIHIGAHIDHIPKAFLCQLKVGGRLFIPTGSPQQIFSIEKRADGSFREEELDYVQYVPLTSKSEQLEY